MFEQTFVQSQATTRKPWTVVVSLSLQCGVVAVILLIPLLHPEKMRMPELPKPKQVATWVNLQAAPPRTSQAVNRTLSTPRPTRTLVYVPTTTHTSATSTVAFPTIDTDAGWAGPSTASFASPLSGAVALPPQATPRTVGTPPAVKPEVSGPLRVSQGAEGAKLIFGPHPTYPQIAIAARSQGTVKLEAIIAADGSIRNLHALGGPPLLVNAALEAVKQWRYQPTLLNGLPVEVLTEIDVNFTLSR